MMSYIIYLQHKACTILSYFHCFSFYVWTDENNSNSLRAGAYFLKKEEKISFLKISGYVWTHPQPTYDLTPGFKPLSYSVRNIPKLKDRANWSRDTFQPKRRRACVYQQTNQNIAPVIKNFQNNGWSRTESVIVSIFKTFHEAYTIFLSGQRIGSHIGSVL